MKNYLHTEYNVNVVVENKSKGCSTEVFGNIEE